MAGLDYTTRDKVLWGALAALCLASAAAYVFWALPAMPETVPTHWGADGTADGWDSKGSTIFMGVVMPFLILALLFAVPQFMVVVAWITPLSALGVLPTAGGSFVNIIVFGFLGLLFVGLGIVMPRIEPNYTFGVRLPWTLADPENWRRTHRFAGPVFVVMGVVTVASALLASMAPELTLVVLLVALLGGVALIALYSFLLWKGAIR